MSSKLMTVEEVNSLLKPNEFYLLAGDEKALAKVNKGNWIGGTIPYFMADQGGVIDQNKVFVTTLPSVAKLAEVVEVDESNLNTIYSRIPQNGFGVLIVPASTKSHLSFAMNAPEYPQFATSPIIGWISGVHLNELGKSAPKTYNGSLGTSSEQKGIFATFSVADGYYCDMGIVNIFKQGTGDKIEILESGFQIKDVLVNGQKTNFADYILKNKIDTKNPLVANYGGAMINVSFQSIDEASKTVNLYAPVFKGVDYRLASPVANYVENFKANLPQNSNQIAFSCNCILNFLYSDLEGKKTAGVLGPITFGEIAYQLLNQTLAYLTIQKH